MGTRNLILCALICVMIVAVFSALFTFIGMLCTNKMVTSIAAIILFLVLILLAPLVEELIRDDEWNRTHAYGDDGTGMIHMMEIPTPDYVRGFGREALDFAMEALPTGQAWQIWVTNTGKPDLYNLCGKMMLSALVTLVFTAAGIFVFGKKDIK